MIADDKGLCNPREDLRGDRARLNRDRRVLHRAHLGLKGRLEGRLDDRFVGNFVQNRPIGLTNDLTVIRSDIGVLNGRKELRKGLEGVRKDDGLVQGAKGRRVD